MKNIDSKTLTKNIIEKSGLNGVGEKTRLKLEKAIQDELDIIDNALGIAQNVIKEDKLNLEEEMKKVRLKERENFNLSSLLKEQKAQLLELIKFINNNTFLIGKKIKEFKISDASFSAPFHACDWKASDEDDEEALIENANQIICDTIGDEEDTHLCPDNELPKPKRFLNTVFYGDILAINPKFFDLFDFERMIGEGAIVQTYDLENTEQHHKIGRLLSKPSYDASLFGVEYESNGKNVLYVPAIKLTPEDFSKYYTGHSRMFYTVVMDDSYFDLEDMFGYKVED